MPQVVVGFGTQDGGIFGIFLNMLDFNNVRFVLFLPGFRNIMLEDQGLLGGLRQGLSRGLPQ